MIWAEELLASRAKTTWKDGYYALGERINRRWGLPSISDFREITHSAGVPIERSILAHRNRRWPGRYLY